MLTEDQIQYLYKFCVKHYVRYYDVQVELVDHLANATEEKMTKNPKLDFETALNEVYKSFGISGFSRILLERELLCKAVTVKVFGDHLFLTSQYRELLSPFLFFVF